MGSHVSETIRKGIADYECFQDDPYTLMYGCMWVCFSVASWLFTASYLEMPVSTTHSCIGGMIGMTIAIKGSDCVIWYKARDTFPYVGGVFGMVLSWFISPILSGLISSSLYGIIRVTILRKKYEDKYIYYGFPLLVGITMLLNSFFIFYKGAKGIGLDDTPLGAVIGISVGIGIFSALLTIPALPKIYNYINTKPSITEIQVVDLETNSSEIIEIESENPKTLYDKIVNININNFDKVDAKDTSIINALNDNAEVFDPRTEEFFKYLQIFSASCSAFSHGANDVANAMGPFAAILTIYWDGDVRKNSVMDKNAYWILSLGGIGISLGLLLYGYRIIRAIGMKLCKITPSRGTVIELSAALVTIFGSRLKIPLSTTHCQIGAICGVGLLESSWNDNVSGINKKYYIKHYSDG